MFGWKRAKELQDRHDAQFARSRDLYDRSEAHMDRQEGLMRRGMEIQERAAQLQTRQEEQTRTQAAMLDVADRLIGRLESALSRLEALRRSPART